MLFLARISSLRPCWLSTDDTAMKIKVDVFNPNRFAVQFNDWSASFLQFLSFNEWFQSRRPVGYQGISNLAPRWVQNDHYPLAKVSGNGHFEPLTITEATILQSPVAVLLLCHQFFFPTVWNCLNLLLLSCNQCCKHARAHTHTHTKYPWTKYMATETEMHCH